MPHEPDFLKSKDEFERAFTKWISAQSGWVSYRGGCGDVDQRDAAKAAARKGAMFRLAREMSSFSFTEEEVLEIWRMSLVKKVQES
jgi:hypothetical protein